jgi:hypothetical protein
MKLFVAVQEAVVEMWLAYLLREAVNSSLSVVGNYAAHLIPKMRDLQLLTLLWSTFSKSGRERRSLTFAYECGRYLSHNYVQPMAALITQDAGPASVEARLNLFAASSWACLSTYLEHKGSQYSRQEH